MSIDCFVIAALADELRGALVGGRVQDVIDLDALALGLEIYASRRRHYLYMSAEPNHPRAHLSAGKLRRGLPKPTQLGLLGRRFVKGGIVTSVSQPEWERLLRIDIDGPRGEAAIIIELVPRRANVLVVQGDLILDCLNRVGPAENRYRLSLPNHAYVPPPPIRGQLHPEHVTPADIKRICAAAKPSTQIRRILPGVILGLSPALAKEVAFRAAGHPLAKARDADAMALHDALREVYAPLLQSRWQPGLLSEDGIPTVASAVPLSYADWQPSESMSQAISAVYGAFEGADAYLEAKKPVQSALDEARSRLRAKLGSLRAGLKDDGDLESLRVSGELILAYQYALSAGQETLRAQYDPAGPELDIRLQPALTPLENAQQYFRRYDKAKSARLALPDLIAEAQVELDFLAQLEDDLLNASSWPQIDEVIQHLQARGHWRGKQRKRIGGADGGPLRLVSRDGFVIWVGRNSRQNEIATFKRARRQDLWLHARDVPGAHVIIRDDGRRISQGLIAEAAAVAAHYSRKRNDSRVRVDYTRVKHVKAIKGAGPGMATYRNERSITVTPQDESILK